MAALAGAGLAAQPSAPSPGPCPAEMAAARARWQAIAPPLAPPSLAPGTTLRHWPTTTLGIWLVEETAADRATLTRVAGDALTRITWTPDCAAATDHRTRPAVAPPAFGDADLAALLDSGARGVLYLWSPHMPLSVDGVAAVTAAARARGLTVEALLDPNADRAFARTQATAHALPASALRVADAVELQFRELALHAPSAVVFAGGRLVGSVLRGYRTADEYAEFFSRVLGERERGEPLLRRARRQQPGLAGVGGRQPAFLHELCALRRRQAEVGPRRLLRPERRQ